MTSSFYKCPHNLFIEQRLVEGLLVYYHEDGSPCALLNNLQTTPEQLLCLKCQTLLTAATRRELAGLIEANEYVYEQLRVRAPKAASELQVLLLGYHNSSLVREWLYGELQRCLQAGAREEALEYFRLVAFFLAQQHYQESLKDFQEKLRGLVNAFGAVVRAALAELEVARQSSAGYRLCHDVDFMLRYEYHPRQEVRRQHEELLQLFKL
ncbi:MAG: hypothetical protein SO119_05645 [Phascolarctobacterium sp.]|nr:hypothetical protein [Phascolarctobacterium sp.]